MNKDVVRVELSGVYPLDQNTMAIYLGTTQKCFVIHVEPLVGRAVVSAWRGEWSERPLTHELIHYIFSGFSIKIERVIINALRSNTYYARLILRAENEVHAKVIEIDARPSDCIVLATQAKAPIFVAGEVWEETDDKTEELEKVRKVFREGKEPPSSPSFGQEED